MFIREMLKDDIEFAFGCTQTEGWLGSSKYAFQSYLEHDAKGCFIAEENARAVGICIATRYINTGFIGELIVIPEMRGKGIGGALFQYATSYLQSHNIHSIYLDGDLTAVPIYEKYGFSKKCLSLRFLGKLAGQIYSEIRPVTDSDLPALYELDKQVFADDRSFFLQRLIKKHNDYCLVWEKNNRLIGYIMARPGQNVIAVGPWVIADTSVQPEIMLQSLAAQTGNQLLRIGVLESNHRAVHYFRNNTGFKEQTPCWRMVLGTETNNDKPELVFAIGSAAKG